MERFVLQKSEKKPDTWVVTDMKWGLTGTFTEHRFNETQKFTLLYDVKVGTDANELVSELAHAMTEIGDWLKENHYDKIF